MRIETRYIARRSMRSMWVWLIHAGAMDTFTQGPMFWLRIFGANINIYPWGKSDKQQRAERQAKSSTYNPKQFRRP